MSRAAALRSWLDRAPVFGELAAEGATVIVACSGGADSLALLALAASAGVATVAVHVDHGLRQGSDADFAVVAAAAARLGARATVSRVDVAHGPNLEARAHDARYQALERARSDAGASVVLVGHTADDQAETVLLNLLRGSATAGLAAMPARQGTIVRPLLGLRRSDTLEICARLQLAPVTDPMNGETRYRRVWLRREVIPLLEAGANRDLRALLARQADVMRDESGLLDALATDALAVAGDPPRVRALATLDPGIARRALRIWLGGAPPTLATIDALLAVVGGARRAVELPGGRRVVRRGGHLVLESSSAAPVATAVEFALPGVVESGALALEAWIERAAPVGWPDGRETCVVDADAVGDRAWLRPAGRGERFAPLGLRGTKPITAAASETPGHPQIVATAPTGGAVWVVGYRIDDRVRVTSRTRRFLWMTVSDRDHS